MITKSDLVWRNIFLLTILHLLALASFFSFVYIRWSTLFIVYAPTLLASLVGITAGAHRLWSHRSYKAHLCLRIFLMICNTIALQNDIYVWCRDHRVHHKYSETDADPHNSKRGFFFAHMGWLMVRKNREVFRKGATIDLTDLKRDPVVMFQRRHYHQLIIIFWLLIPTLLPYLLFDENIIHSFLTCVCFRYVYSLHSTWLVNSVAHLYGNRPYDRRIEPRENRLVIMASFGEGYHNYHHTFPWDYSTSEFGWMGSLNLTTMIIDLFVWLGLAYDRKMVSSEIVHRRMARSGHNKLSNDDNRKWSIIQHLFGWFFGSMALWLPASVRIISNLFNGCHWMT